MDNIKNKTALVTGGALGLGFTYVQKLLKNGAKAVAILDLNPSAGQTAQANLEKEFGKGKAMFFPCDVSNYAQFAETFKKIWNAWNGLDIVINNAGILNDKNWEQTLRINVGGVIQGSLLAMDYMGKHKGGKGGTLVNIASIVALDTYPVCSAYCASKHDVMAFSRCLQARWEQTGVRVLVICPGVTSTLLFTDFENKTLDFVEPAEVKEMFATLPSQQPENVGNAMMQLIQKGENGSIWVSEDKQPPYAIEFCPPKKIQLNL